MMNLIDKEDVILNKVCTPFDFNDPIMDPYDLVKELQDVRRNNNGVGLAASQVGIDTRVMVIGMGDFVSEGVEDFAKCFFNPSIDWSQMETDIPDNKKLYMIEGCLTYPRLFVKIKRVGNIILEWYTEEGTKCLDPFSGITSRIVQHEVDHLNGITFNKRANPYHLDKAKKDLKKRNRLINKQMD